MARTNTGSFWSKHERLLECLTMASAFLAIIFGSLAPDFDVLWHGHKGWTHNPYIPMGVCLAMVVLIIGQLAYLSRQNRTGVLR
mgnify:FL=1